MADFDLMSALSGAAQGYVPSYGDVSPYAGMSAPTDPFAFQLGISGPNWGSLSGPMATASMFMGLMGVQNPMASLGMIGGPSRYNPSSVLAGRQYSRLAKDMSLMRASDEGARAAFVQDFSRFETTLMGETTGVRSDLATMYKAPDVFGGKGEVDAISKGFSDKLKAIEAMEADPNSKFDRSQLAQERTKLAKDTSAVIAAKFSAAGKSSETYANRTSERADALAQQLQQNPEMLGLVGMMAKELGVEGELDKLEIYRKAATQAGAIQFGYGGGGRAAVDVLGPDSKKVQEFAQTLDAKRAELGFEKQGITSTKVTEVMTAMSTRGLGGVEDPAKQAQAVAEISETMKELEAVFGPGAPVEEIMRSLERMANSSIAGMGQSKIRAWGQKVQAVADMANMSTQDLARAVEGGAQDAIRRGMSGEIGAAAALSGVAGATVLREQVDRGGAGALTESQAQSTIYQAGLEVSQSRMGRTIGNVYGLAVTQAMQRSGGKLDRKAAEALSMDKLVEAAGLQGKAADVLLGSVSARGGTTEYMNQFTANNEGDLIKQLASSLGMSDSAVRSNVFSDLSASESSGVAMALSKGFIQVGNMREKFTDSLSAGFSSLRSSSGGKQGDVGKVNAMLDAAMSGKAEFDINKFTKEEVAVMQDSATSLGFGSVESMLAMVQGSKNAGLAERAVSFNSALAKAGYGQKTTTANILGLVFGGTDGNRRSLKQAMSEAAGGIDIKATVEALEKSGFGEKERADILRSFEDKDMTEQLLKDAASGDQGVRDKALRKLQAVQLEGTAEAAERERESGTKLQEALEKLTTAISKESGESGKYNVKVEFTGEAAELFKVNRVDQEPVEKPAQK